ncbi:MAG: hypothetical protein LQ338_003306 [Usnochroma carphineum]|nr:MAG: hypothetical protein LQ338_003306 [Usnochroma carphineum]
MAAVTSLGMHTPAAVSYLVAEGLLPAEATEDPSKWQKVDRTARDGDAVEEELFITDYGVIWTQGSTVRRVFRFESEKEKVTQAAFAKFPSHVAATTNVVENTPQVAEQSSWTAMKDFSAEQGGKAPDRTPRVASGHGQTAAGSSIVAQSVTSRLKKEWAIVVILKTQAHIFFLRGKSHIVHLPFDVERIFPMPGGILLQRKLSPMDGPWETSPASEQLPAAPPNSFAFSQYGSQGYSAASLHQLYSDNSSPISSMLNKVLQKPSKSKANNLPRLFSLTDPLNQLGTVSIKHVKNDHAPNDSFTNASNSLNLGHDLLYVSSQDEVGNPYGTASALSPFTLAVTLNRQTSALTVWQVTRADSANDGPRKRRIGSLATGTYSRRRSSRGPGTGPGTGATTPMQRGANIRESLGNARGRAAEDRVLPVSDAFSLSLDAAFNHSALPAKSSRRVSSLLARAELSSSQDNATFSELAEGNHVHQHARRGPSFGADPMRSSFGRDAAIGVSRLRPRRDIRASAESHSQYGLDSDDDFEYIDKMDTLSALDALDIGDGASSLRHEYEMTELYSTKMEHQSNLVTSKRDQGGDPTIFTFRPPVSSLRGDSGDPSVYLCFIDRVAHILLSLRIQVRPTPSIHTKPFHAHNDGLGYVARVTNMARLKDVADACILKDHDCTRVLVLSQSADGMGYLCLHAPWSTPHDIALPGRLNVYDPTKITLGASPRQKREGSFKRILSQGLRALSALSEVDGLGKVDVTDGKGVRHCLHIQLQPLNLLVKRIIDTCDAVMPLSGERQETILSAWWTVTSWLKSRPEKEHDLEWTALLIVLFSIPAGSIQTWHSEPTSRQKRRKAAFLRSSSGANTDLTSWEAMLGQEAGHSGPLPPWMQDAAWRWVTGQSASAEAQRASATSHWSPRPMGLSNTGAIPAPKKSAYLLHCTSLAREASKFFGSSDVGPSNLTILPFLASQDHASRGAITANLLVGLHLLREELKLNSAAAEASHSMTPVLAQLGGWLGWKSWGFKDSTYYALESVDMENWLFDESTMGGRGFAVSQPFEPPSILQHIEKTLMGSTTQPFMTLLDLVDLPSGPPAYLTAPEGLKKRVRALTPRIIAIAMLFATTGTQKMEFSVDNIASSGIDSSLLETLPESIAASIRWSMSQAQASPSSGWTNDMLGMVGRDDLLQLGQPETRGKHLTKPLTSNPNHVVGDVHTICASTADVESIGAYDGSTEADRQAITRMIFNRDQRFAEAARLVHPLTAPTARCVPEPAWSDTELLEAQQELVKTIATRTLSVSPGRSMLFYNARSPLLTEKFPIHGFTLSCVMKPTNITVTADRNAYTEEKVSWAFFHAGVEAGLSISKDAKGITTSWLHFNKPHELKNRHAGFLLALGLNGHMKNVAKWASYKYLQPKHAMTSIGFLLGCSASYLGTMDLNITRLLSVHIKRMLPAGAAELNLSPVTQTASLMGIGLLYCNTQHRRMSEILLSEIENTEQEENAAPSEDLRNEGYRLAAGFALGYINLGRGTDLRGLHDMQVVERLLVLATGTKKADLVHVLDRATAAATVAIALMFMKTGNATVACKIDVPDTIHQFDYVRPDILLLRTVSRHLIMWDDIRPSAAWMHEQLPPAFQSRRQLAIRSVSSQELPYMNILAGLCLSLGLRYAGTGQLEVRNLLCHQLDQFMWMSRLPSTNYDRRLTRITARNCQDTVALAVACVMAGTGDLYVFRRLRSLHGRTDAETPYGSHLAAHLAIGVLFLGGGTHSFGTSNIAVATLLCAFYPLFPNDVLDNKSHLQAFRHFWVLATEPRCLIIRDLDTHRPLSLPLTVKLQNGATLPMIAPCLLPELQTIATLAIVDAAYWPVTLNLAENPRYLLAFKRHQTIYVRRRAAGDSNASIFSATMLALNDAQSAGQLNRQVFEWIFTLPVFQGFDRTEQALVLPRDLANVVDQAAQATAVDDSLVLTTGCMESGRSERLWNLRLLFAWADALARKGTDNGPPGWLREDVVRELRARVGLRVAEQGEG